MVTSSTVAGGVRRKRTTEDKNDKIERVFGSGGSRKGIWGHYCSGQDEKQKTEGKNRKKGIGRDQREGIWGPQIGHGRDPRDEMSEGTKKMR